MVDNFAAVLAFDYAINNIIQLNLDLMFLLILIQLEPTLSACLMNPNLLWLGGFQRFSLE